MTRVEATATMMRGDGFVKSESERTMSKMGSKRKRTSKGKRSKLQNKKKTVASSSTISSFAVVADSIRVTPQRPRTKVASKHRSPSGSMRKKKKGGGTIKDHQEKKK